MENYPFIKQLQQQIQDNFSDIRAEALLAIAMENGLTENDFAIAPDSLFSRPYSRDIIFSAIEEDANRKNYLQLHVSRSGLHDQLPEGIFYQSAKAKKTVTHAATMAAEYKIDKQKEREIRRFFMPFENAFFRQRLQVEVEENLLLAGLQSGILNEYFIKFWDISPAIPQMLITPLIELLPYAHKIAGNLAIITQCLEKVLQEKVSVHRILTPATLVDTAYMCELGTGQLGMDMVVGKQFIEDFPVVEFTIGPLTHSKLQDYLEGGNRKEFLTTFYNFFVPVEADVTTRIELAKDKQYMILNTEEEPVLGYSSVLLET